MASARSTVTGSPSNMQVVARGTSDLPNRFGREYRAEPQPVIPQLGKNEGGRADTLSSGMPLRIWRSSPF